MAEASRHNSGKPALSEILFWPQAWAELAAHAEAGRAKYPDAAPGVPNWSLGGKPDEEYLDAAMRHLVAIKRGEEYDPDLGTTHAAAVIWNLATLVQCNRDGRDTSIPLFEGDPAAAAEGPRWEVTVEGQTGKASYREDLFEDGPGYLVKLDAGGRREYTVGQYNQAIAMGVVTTSSEEDE